MRYRVERITKKEPPCSSAYRSVDLVTNKEGWYVSMKDLRDMDLLLQEVKSPITLVQDSLSGDSRIFIEDYEGFESNAKN